MNPLWISQILAILRLEIGKSFLSKRGLWIYLLAAAPLVIFVGHAIQKRFDQGRLQRAATTSTTWEKMEQVHEGMTREEVFALLPEPGEQNGSSRRRRRGDDDMEWEHLVFSDGRKAISVSLEDRKVTSVNSRWRPCNLTEDLQVYAAVFQFFYIRLAIFFGCMFVFMNLFRGEMLDKTLHYYFLTPVRREVLLAGKYLAGLIATGVIFGVSTIVQTIVFLNHFDPAVRAEYMDNGAIGHALSYVGVTVLACLGYGAAFLAAGVLIRNPLIPAALVLLWESINGILPALLRKFSVIYYLKSLCPVEVAMAKNVPPPLAMLALNVDPATPILAIAGLLAVAVAVLFFAARRVRKLEVNYSTEG